MNNLQLGGVIEFALSGEDGLKLIRENI